MSSCQCHSDSNWLEDEKKSLSIDLALDRGFHLWLSADKWFLNEAASLSGLEGEEGRMNPAVERIPACSECAPVL